MAQDGEGSKLRMVCARCGSEQVTRDAWAEWDGEAQEWRLGALFDHAWCHGCQRETRVEGRGA